MLKDLIFSLLATISFAFLFEIKGKNIIFSGICGCIGWMLYSNLHLGNFISPFISSIAIIICARIFAKINKAPTPIFYIPGLFPIVPGAGIYSTAYSIVKNDWNNALLYGSITIKTSVAIVLGIAIISLIPYNFNFKNKKYKYINPKT